MNLEAILQVALGNVEKPVIHASIGDSKEIKFEGDRARLFAIGFLSGVKASKSDSTVEITSEIN